MVTGADCGIGRAVAIAFAREGADVVLSYLPAEEADATEVVALVEEAGRRAVAVPDDLRRRRPTSGWSRRPSRSSAGIDILVNDAGKQVAVEDIADLTTEQFDATFRTNVYALFWLTKAALPHMAGRAIINTSSVQAYSRRRRCSTTLDEGRDQHVHQGARAAGRRQGDPGQRRGAGPVLDAAAGQRRAADREAAGFGAQTPLGRAGQPAELAARTCSWRPRESSYVIGETLSATGGKPTP